MHEKDPTLSNVHRFLKAIAWGWKKIFVKKKKNQSYDIYFLIKTKGLQKDCNFFAFWEMF